MKLSNKLILLACSVINFSLYAEDPPPPGGGDTGTPGVPASPIDLYLYVLVIAAIILTFYYMRKSKRQIA